MARFKLLAGTHTVPATRDAEGNIIADATTIQPGGIIESVDDLCVQFNNGAHARFEPVADSAPLRSAGPPPDARALLTEDAIARSEQMGKATPRSAAHPVPAHAVEHKETAAEHRAAVKEEKAHAAAKHGHH